MIISFSSINKFFDKQLDVFEVSEKLTLAGLEVDSIEPIDFSSIDSNVVVGKITDILKHPNADKLKVCKVEISDESFQIVCGASNINVGDLVPLAKIGAKLPTGLKIKKSKIRDIESYGMLCSLSELGIGYDISDGIFLIPDNFKVGQSLNTFIELNDYILDFGITPNRGDCLSALGIAREVSVLMDLDIVSDLFDIEDNQVQAASLNGITVKSNSDSLRRYCLIEIDDIKVTESPFWLKNFLAKFNISSINNVVDCTNYFMLLFGHPIHAFDRNKISTDKIVISDKKDAEIQTLSGEQVKLNDVLAILDSDKPIAIAGIVGGIDSSVTFKTQKVLIECASFSPSTIRKNSKKLNISTESSFRFERDVPPYTTKMNILVAANLIKNICGGTISKEYIDTEPNLKNKTTINLNFDRLKKVIGIQIDNQEVIKILKSLNINSVELSKLDGVFEPPYYRSDLKSDQDLIEEVARIKGIDNIPLSPPNIPITHFPKMSFQNFRRIKKNIRSTLLNEGFSEVINFSFLDKSILKNFDSKSLKIVNPLSSDSETLRTSLLPSVLQNFLYNINHGFESIRLFELGKIFLSENGSTEKEQLVFLSTEIRENSFWNKDKIDFYEIKGSLFMLLKNLNLDLKNISLDSNLSNYQNVFHPGKSCEVFYNHESIGFLGEIHPEFLNDLGIKKVVIGSIVELDKISELKIDIKKMQKFTNFPQVKRDISLLVDDKVESGEILTSIMNSKVNILRDVKLFDYFKNEKIGDSKVSLSFSLVFESFEKTLQDDEVVKAMEKIIKNLESNFDMEVRS
tara:strand:+ start:7818 stop:10217 length:2400 start_codon:yes stop_codon:yes gene_type:complete